MIDITDDEFRRLIEYIRSNFGVNLEKKRALVEGRLGFYIFSKGFKSYDDYFEYAKKDPTKQELTHIINRLTTNHTYFMREEDHFSFYRYMILPWIEEQGKDIRVWSAGCSTGQEPYTIAMTNLDYTQGQSDWDTTVLASDISDKVLSAAKAGIYTENDIADIPADWLTKYFEPYDDEHYRITKDLRESVVFRNINLLHDFHFKKSMQVVFCRNVMIYFDTPTKLELIKKFHRIIEPGGYLLLGHSESLSTIPHDFTYIRPSVYRKL